MGLCAESLKQKLLSVTKRNLLHGLATALDSDSLGFEFLIFIVREGLSIARICFEGHRVDWVLGFLLVEAVFIAIFPIGETILVTA